MPIRYAIKYFLSNKHIISKFAVVGISAAIIDFSFYIIFTDLLHIYYLTANVLSFIIAAIFNFLVNRKWTFQSNGKKRKQFPVFLAVVVTGTILNSSILGALVSGFKMYDLLAKVIATAASTIWNYCGNRYITFRKSEGVDKATSDQDDKIINT